MKQRSGCELTQLQFICLQWYGNEESVYVTVFMSRSHVTRCPIPSMRWGTQLSMVLTFVAMVSQSISMERGWSMLG